MIVCRLVWILGTYCRQLYQMVKRIYHNQLGEFGCRYLGCMHPSVLCAKRSHSRHKGRRHLNKIPPLLALIVWRIARKMNCRLGHQYLTCTQQNEF